MDRQRPLKVDADALLRSGAGRQFCKLLALVSAANVEGGPFSGGHPVDKTGKEKRLSNAIKSEAFLQFLDSRSERSLLDILSQVVLDGFWFIRDDESESSKNEGRALEAVALAVLQAKSTQWWSAEAPPNKQHFVFHILEDGVEPPTKSRFHSTLDIELDHDREAETTAREEDDDSLGANTVWAQEFSRPDGALWTTQSVEDLPAVDLVCFPDLFGPHRALYWEAKVDQGSRIFEINGPEDWRELVSRYPRDVSYSRRRSWREETGWSGGWLIPDWSLVRRDFDGLHLSVLGYLETVGRCVVIGEHRSNLVAWGPDQVFWLNDVVTLIGSAQEWLVE